MKAGSLKHSAASLLHFYYVCRGPLKPSIFIYNVGLYTHIHIFQICVWWYFVAAKSLSGFHCMLGPQTAVTMASWLIASVYVSAVPAIQQLQTQLQLAPLNIYLRLNSKKGFYYSNGVCMFNNHDNWKHGAEDPPECV